MTHTEIVKNLAGVCEVFLKDISIQRTYQDLLLHRHRLNWAMEVVGNIKNIYSKKQSAYRNTQETQCVVYV